MPDPGAGLGCRRTCRSAGPTGALVACASKSPVAQEDSRPGAGDNQVSEIIALVKTYAKQETIDPLKGIGRYLLFGVAGSLALGIGVVLVLIALLRVLQTETGSAFDGNWSWVPYVITLVVTAAVAGLAIMGIGRGRSRRGEKGARG
jgi:hypothetical protein